ncbi:MAG: YkgJ family cysteine cluster protein, partial [Candidatus Diapherotrites archaeon]|nr:YkgJ family cysteine cluster protein [Candidatus Diapherotrites archaeon]
IQEYCVIYLQIFPSEFKQDKTVLFNSLLPKKIALALQEKISLPQYFKILPMLALKRPNGKACIHLDEKAKNCKIYPARPKQCELFPFISLKDTKDFSKIYPFCVGLQKTGTYKEGYREEQEKHFKENAKYFDALRQQEFKEFWPEIPATGILLYKELEVCEISRAEFEKILEAMQ